MHLSTIIWTPDQSREFAHFLTMSRAGLTLRDGVKPELKGPNQIGTFCLIFHFETSEKIYIN